MELVWVEADAWEFRASWECDCGQRVSSFSNSRDAGQPQPLVTEFSCPNCGRHVRISVVIEAVQPAAPERTA